jgi:hypothetical protein
MQYCNYKILILAFSILVLSSCGKTTQEEQAKKSVRTCEDAVLSYTYAKDFIKRNLKAPATAKFPSFREISHSYKGNCTHRLIGSVDAQNSFGALTRNNFDVTVRYDRVKEIYYLEYISVE